MGWLRGDYSDSVDARLDAEEEYRGRVFRLAFDKFKAALDAGEYVCYGAVDALKDELQARSKRSNLAPQSLHFNVESKDGTTLYPIGLCQSSFEGQVVIHQSHEDFAVSGWKAPKLIWVRSDIGLDRVSVVYLDLERRRLSDLKIVGGGALHDSPCETYSESERKAAEILAKKEADAAAELKKRQDIIDAGYTITSQSMRTYRGRHIFQNPVILRDSKKIVAFRIELVSSGEWSGRLKLSIPENLDERAIILSYKEREEILELAYRDLELVSELQLRREEEDKENRIVDSYYNHNQKSTATVSGKDSPFAALAALKK